MSDALSFGELLQLLPAGHMFGERRSAEFGIAETVSMFVEPTLKCVLEEAADDATVTLISARGATGKTTLAKQLSGIKQVPLWSLHSGPGVSADALRGRLMDYNSPVDALDSFVKNASTFVVVDSLDEAKMRVSGSSWNEFIQSLIKVSRTNHKLVLLGRDRVLEDVWVSFADQGLKANWFEVSYFDHEQRKLYVDTYVGNAARGESYNKARDAVLAALTSTVDKPNADTFVGYAPVLDAVAALLKKGNLKRIYNDFSDDVVERRRLTVLQGILDRLLVREQEKIAPLAQQLELDPKDAYGADEQFDWLIHELLGGAPPTLMWCPAEKRHEYADRVREFVGVHCFRTENGWASPVFSAYVAARKFDHQVLRDSLKSIADSTGLLFEFVAVNPVGQFLDEWQFAALHASLLSGEWHGAEASVRVEGAGDGGIEFVQGELVLLEGHEVVSRITFDLVLEEVNRISLLGPLSGLSVVFPRMVSVNRGGQGLILGPDLFLACQDLSITCDSVQISRTADVDSKESQVVLEVAGDFRCEGILSNTVPVGALELHVPRTAILGFPWVNHRQDLLSDTDVANDRVVRFLNMFMSLTRKHGHDGDAAVYIKKLEGRQSIKGEELQGVLEVMKRHGVVYCSGDMIYLSLDWSKRRFSGKAIDGVLRLEDKLEIWKPVLNDMEAAVKR